MEYQANGTITLEVSKNIEANKEKEAIQMLFDKFNTYGISKITLNVELEDGSMHKIEVNDHDIEWNHVEEVEEKREKATKQTA